MKRLFLFISAFFISTLAIADTETINWYVDGTSYATTTCQTGGDIILPNTPYKYGYTFQGWIYYTTIEYLKSTGAQWIDTGIIVNSDYIVEVKGIFNCGQIPCGQEGSGFYNNNSLGSFFVLAIACSSEGSNWGGYSINSTASQLGINDQNPYTLKIDKHGIYVDGARKLSFPEYGVKTYASKNFLLFGTKSPSYGYSSDTIFYLKIWDDNNVLVRSLVPVLDENGTPCMYDKVTQQFFYNQGTGGFVAGPVINQ